MERFILVIIFLIGVLFFLRFLFRGNEGFWICEKGKWVRHGNPNSPMLSTVCGVKTVEDSKEKPEDISVCYSPDGTKKDFALAEKIAKEKCVEGKIKGEHFCNEITGTWSNDFRIVI